MFKSKKIIAIGERDGIASPALSTCVQAAGGEVILAATECFV
jgi:glycine/sarcosine/betaine reductase complex component A